MDAITIRELNHYLDGLNKGFSILKIDESNREKYSDSIKKEMHNFRQFKKEQRGLSEKQISKYWKNAIISIHKKQFKK